MDYCSLTVLIEALLKQIKVFVQIVLESLLCKYPLKANPVLSYKY